MGTRGSVNHFWGGEWEFGGSESGHVEGKPGHSLWVLSSLHGDQGLFELSCFLVHKRVSGGDFFKHCCLPGSQGSDEAQHCYYLLLDFTDVNILGHICSKNIWKKKRNLYYRYSEPMQPTSFPYFSPQSLPWSSSVWHIRQTDRHTHTCSEYCLLCFQFTKWFHTIYPYLSISKLSSISISLSISHFFSVSGEYLRSAHLDICLSISFILPI